MSVDLPVKAGPTAPSRTAFLDKIKKSKRAKGGSTTSSDPESEDASVRISGVLYEDMGTDALFP